MGLALQDVQFVCRLPQIAHENGAKPRRVRFPVVRLITRWLAPRRVPPRELSSINGRLERIETAVDSIALEVERISEAQRF